jgi:hypothetical protein
MPQDNDSIQQTSIKRSEAREAKHSETPEARAAALREDIARTRSALSEDVKALGEKIKPERLKEEAKQIIQHAADATREGAKHIVHDAKDAALDSLRNAKDAAFGSLRNAKEHAFESVSEGGRQMGVMARKAGREVSDFAGTNALPLTLLGAGAGWLLMTMHHSRRLRLSYGDSREPNYYGDGQIHSAVSHARERSNRAHPLLIGLLALGAGAAVAMFLPASRRENTLVGGARDRLVHKAQESASELKGSLRRGAEGVREAVGELSAGRA